MKDFLRKRWHGAPIAVLALVLIAGVVAASYAFLAATVEVFVDEPLYVEYNLQGEYGGDDLWHEFGDLDSATLDRSAGDNFVFDLRVTNHADNPLTVTTVVTGVGVGWFTFTGFPDGDVCDNGVTLFADATMVIDGATPGPETYSLVFTFYRS